MSQTQRRDRHRLNHLCSDLVRESLVFDGCVLRLIGHTNSYHLHMAALQIALQPSRGDWLRGVFGIATAIAVVGNIIDRDLLFSIHDCGRGCCEVKEGGE